jgi:hypothetical protein
MTLSQAQLLALSNRLLVEAKEYSERLTHESPLFDAQYTISCVLSSLAAAVRDVYEAGKPSAEERQYEGK